MVGSWIVKVVGLLDASYDRISSVDALEAALAVMDADQRGLEPRGAPTGDD